MLEDFLLSQDTHIINHIQLEKKEHKYAFGLNVFEELVKYVEYIKKEKREIIDKRPFHIIVELQKVMKWRIGYIQKKYGNFVEKNTDLIKQMQHQYIEAEILQSLVLKYNVLNQSEFVDSIIKRLIKFQIEEEKLLVMLLQLMRKIHDDKE